MRDDFLSNFELDEPVHCFTDRKGSYLAKLSSGGMIPIPEENKRAATFESEKIPIITGRAVDLFPTE
jgi:hypothetical protein